MQRLPEFSLVGRQIQPGSMEIGPYLQESWEVEHGDLRMFPAAEEQDFSESEVVRLHQANRLRWFAKFCRVHPSAVYGAWLDEDIFLEEGRLHDKLSPGEFQAASKAFGLYMLRREVRLVNYYRQIRRFLAARIWHHNNVLVFGPTAGAEVEVAEDVGGFPLVCTGEGTHSALCCERLLHDKVIYEPLTLDELLRTPPDVHFIILTHYLLNPVAMVNLAYNLLGLYGWIICPAEYEAVVAELEDMELVRRDGLRSSAAVFFKHVGLPYQYQGRSEQLIGA